MRSEKVQNPLFRLHLHKISAVRFHLDWIPSGTGSPYLFWVYAGPVPPWKGTVPNWITFPSGLIWFWIEEPIYSGSDRSCINARLNFVLNFVPVPFVSVPNGSGTKLVQKSITFIWDLTDPLQIGSPIRYQTGSLVKVIKFGTMPFQGGTETV